MKKGEKFHYVAYQPDNNGHRGVKYLTNKGLITLIGTGLTLCWDIFHKAM
jgi:hypothetical protein